MANIGYLKINKSDEYIDLENELGFDFVEGETYHIQIQGACMISEALEKPLSGMVFWNILKPFDFLKGSSKLWIQVQSPVANISVWDDKAEEPKPEPEPEPIQKPVWLPIEEGFNVTQESFDWGGQASVTATNTDEEGIYTTSFDCVFNMETSKTKFNNLVVAKNSDPIEEAELYIRVQTEGSQEFLDFPVNGVVLETTSENSFSWHYKDGLDKEYVGSIALEADEDDETKGLFYGGEVIENHLNTETGEIVGEATVISDACYLYVKAGSESQYAYLEIPQEIRFGSNNWDDTFTTTFADGDYNVTIYSHSMPDGINVSVTKDSKPVEASLWYVIVDSNNQEVARKSVNDMVIELTSGSTWDWRFEEDSYVGYEGVSQLEKSADETPYYFFSNDGLMYNGETFDGDAKLLVKVGE